MSIFTIMNGVAWALCLLIVFLIGKDIFHVEKKRRQEQKEQVDKENKDM